MADFLLLLPCVLNVFRLRNCVQLEILFRYSEKNADHSWQYLEVFSLVWRFCLEVFHCVLHISFIKRSRYVSIIEPSHDKTSLIRDFACAQWVAKDPSFLHADSEDSDQTGWMTRLIWVFAGCTVILLVLSWGGSFFSMPAFWRP